MSKSSFSWYLNFLSFNKILKSFVYKTAIDYARQNEHQEIVDLLLNASIQQNKTGTKSSMVNENWCQ